MWVKTKPIEEVQVCEASPGPPMWHVYVSGSVHGSAFFFWKHPWRLDVTLGTG